MRAAVLAAPLLAAALLAGPAQAQRDGQAGPPPQAGPALAAELAQPRIAVDTAFTGADLLVFGATDRLLGPAGDNVVVLGLGEPRDVVVRRRVRRLGIWVNGPSARFREVPNYYALAATAPVAGLLDEPARRERRLGLDVLTARLPGPRDTEFRQALIDLKRSADQWNEEEAPVEVSGGRLFHARLPLPSTIATGDYVVQVMLVRANRIIARQELSFRVDRVGATARIANFSRGEPFLYGLACVALAALAGWLGSVVFRRG
ncbi:TIGR02186 family protein [Pararoseomonas indoligenes]|uniref:TIGR02186 family protein n=1 Tax=Roseomonas indoligenes TaxID=2820811 RepID=A0A940N3K7_9PROT|nr:TIGR02186 family protein [Pararoseomonas indoligenes]MBP0495376.1 TIGR02186 family protein [Pararoseomonas indoligenes]